MNNKEIEEQYQAGRTNFAGIDFEGQKFEISHLQHCDFRNANFRNANLDGVDLSHSNLSGANLENASFQRAKLLNVNLRYAHLEQVDLTYSNLNRGDLEGANLHKAVLSRIKLIRGNLNNTNLSYGDLRGAELQHTTLQNANLTGANISSADLEGADLRGANLNNTIVSNVYWLQVQLDTPELLPDKEGLIWRVCNTDLKDLQGVDLTAANLKNVSLEGVDLTGANLSGAFLLGTRLNEANLSQTDLSKTYLAGANLANANLTGANLENTNLGHATLRGFGYANFSGANLKDIKFAGTSFLYADLTDAINIPPSIVSASIVPLHNPNGNLIHQIRASTKELFCHSEDEQPYWTFLWDIESKGPLNLEKLFQSLGYLKPTNLNILEQQTDDSKLLSAVYERIINEIEEYLESVEIYSFETEFLQMNSSVMPCIIIAKTQTGDWLGISTQATSIDIKTEKKFYVKDEAAIKYDNQELVVSINEVIQEVSYLLPNAEGMEKLVWELTGSRQATIQNILLATKHFAIKRADEDPNSFYKHHFLQKDNGNTPEELQRRQTFADLVNSNLTNIRLYMVGHAQIDFCLIGETQNHDWIGIHTNVTWS